MLAVTNIGAPHVGLKEGSSPLAPVLLTLQDRAPLSPWRAMPGICSP